MNDEVKKEGITPSSAKQQGKIVEDSPFSALELSRMDNPPEEREENGSTKNQVDDVQHDKQNKGKN
ncbi:hypothetical protein [Pedobacter sp.]|uniref:hypothetical protein n=1 Tax=Pedobacter sp. TaxID=1411316 RepID=UPI003BA88D54